MFFRFSCIRDKFSTFFLFHIDFCSFFFSFAHFFAKYRPKIVFCMPKKRNFGHSNEITGMMRRLYLLLSCVTCCALLYAQESRSVYNFLSISSSSHAVALGGRNISSIEDDLSLAFQNPALLGSVNDKSLNLNFMTYMKGSKLGSAGFSKMVGERGTWGVGAQFAGYGSIKETLASGEIVGDSQALDMVLDGMYSYSLDDHWVGGVTGKFLYSKYAGYSSCALAVDLGVNYYDWDRDFSFSAVAANLGGQVKAFGDEHERLPFDLAIGFTKGIAHAPVKITVTMNDLTRWNKDYFYTEEEEPGFGRILMNHLNLGVELLPTDRMYVALGYNFRRASEMKAAGSSHAAGLTCGAGISLKRFKLGLAYAKYHVSAPSFSFSLGYSL